MPAASEIPSEVWARLKGLRLRARVAPRGQGSGLHASRERGAGDEFAQYRAYEPGDEPRRIDWKLYARSDRYFVREATRDASLTVWLLIDATASMSQADAARPAYRKLDAAKRLAACIGELALQQGDRFGFVAVGGVVGSAGRASIDAAAHDGSRQPGRGGIAENRSPTDRPSEDAMGTRDGTANPNAAGSHRDRSSSPNIHTRDGGPASPLTGIPAAGGARQRDRFRLGLEALQCGGSLPDADALRPLWERLAPDTLVVLLSDGFDDALTSLAERLAAARRQLMLVQLLSAEERDFPFRGGHRFRDPETGASLHLAADAARDDYLQRFGTAQAALKQRLAAAGIAHVKHVLDEAPDGALRRLFGAAAAAAPAAA